VHFRLCILVQHIEIVMNIELVSSRIGQWAAALFLSLVDCVCVSVQANTFFNIFDMTETRAAPFLETVRAAVLVTCVTSVTSVLGLRDYHFIEIEVRASQLLLAREG
jgi:hypothetical protein